MSKILFVSSEAFPLVKTGGLGDVAGTLPVVLQENAQDVRLLLPAYPEVLSKISKSKVRAVVTYYSLEVQILEALLPGSQVVVWLIHCPSLYSRPGGPYTDDQGHVWHDNALRFTLFCHAAVDIALQNIQLGWLPDVVHCNDWQTGLIPALLDLHPIRPATVFTIHNLAYQGVFDYQTFVDLHIPGQLWHLEGVEFHGNFSFIKGGIAYADEITTVSPGYANEILSPEFGYGLDGLLSSRSGHLTGVLNGIDEEHWNPDTDKDIKQKYNIKSLDKKVANKLALQEELSLPVDADIPMVGIISRLVEQKGFDTILQSMATILLDIPVQMVILGTGETHYELLLFEWAHRYPDKLKVIIGYNEPLAHRVEAASDIYLMPSTFEPCGLNQLYSLRYGTLPIVTNVGGLADTVIDANKENLANKTANGFVFEEQTFSGLLITLKRALTLYKKPKVWRQLQVNAMSGDFSWQTSAEHYIDIYLKAIDAR